MKKIATGYNTPNLIGPFRIPVPLQNRIFKSYCNDLELSSSVPVGEIFSEKDTPELTNLLHNANSSQIILFCSGQVFNNSSPEMQNLLMRTVSNGVQLHFILERLIIKNELELSEWLGLSKIKKLSENNHQMLKSLPQ